MTCSADLLEAYLDKELDAARQAAVEQHLTECANCSEIYARLSRQKAGIRAAAPYYNVPPALEASLRHEVRRLGAEAGKPERAMPWRWLAIAAALLLAVSLGWNLAQWRSRSGETEMAKTVLDDHIRSLLSTHLVEVESSDQHTVKPWFAGKLDFSPDVKDLAAQGFPLAGGRVDYLADRRVAALVYHRRQHVITLFIWPSGGATRESSASRNGYNLLRWTEGSMTYWAVSDAGASELENFRSLLK